MRILVLDTETTGIKHNHDKVLEVGAALYSTWDREILWAYSTLLPGFSANAAEEINHITAHMLTEATQLYSTQLPWAKEGPLAPLVQLCQSGSVDAIAAHNASFDKRFMEATIAPFHGVDGKPIPWVCTKSDVKYPNQGRNKSLRYLAVDHGIPLGMQQHRALADVFIICELFGYVEDLDEQFAAAIEVAHIPKAVFMACVSYDDRDLAKKAGFKWNASDRRWEKELPETTPIQATDDRPFNLYRVR